MLFFLGFLQSKAQEISLPFRHYSIEHGLANSDVYEIIRDNKGYLWLATDYGLSRFDGLNFKNYYTENGLADNSLTALGQRGDTLYISCYRKGIQRMVNGVFEKTLCVASKNQAYIRTSKDSVYAFRQTNLFDNLQMVHTLNAKQLYQNYPQNSVLYASNRSSKRDFFSLNLNNYDLYRNGVFYRHLPSSLKGAVLYGIDQTPEGELFFGSAGKYFMIDKNDKLKTFNSKLLATFKKIDIILKDKKGRIWYRDMFGQAVVEINGRQLSINQLLNIDEGVAIRHIFYDENNGNIWVATGGKGVFCFYNDFIENYSLSNADISNKVNALDTDDQNRLWIGVQEGFFYLDKGKLLPHKIDFDWKLGKTIKKSYDNFILGYTNQSGNVGVIYEKKYLGKTIIYTTPPHEFIDENHILLNNYRLIEKKNHHWYLSGTNLPANTNYAKYSKIFADKEPTDAYINVRAFKNKITYAYLQQNDTTWVGSSKGLLCLIWSKDRKMANEIIPFPKSLILAGGITKIKRDREGNIVILSDKGLAILKNNQLFFEGNLYRNQKVLGANCIEFDDKNRIWIGTNQGLMFFDEKKTLHFNNKNGLVSSEINALKFDKINNQMWVGTNDGLSKIDLITLEKTSFFAPTLAIAGVSNLLGTFFKLSDNLRFSPDQNYLAFHLSVSDYTSPETIKYEYILDRNAWNKGDSTLILPAVSSGRHSIFFRVKNDNSEWSTVQKLDFEIVRPLYQNWLFWLVISLAFIGIVYWGFENARQKQLSQQQLKRQILSLKEQGMASMMNPHFIFNALNAIQYYINTNDLLLVNEYLSKFGKLIRLNLESVFNNSIILKDELSFIDLYLSVEKLRFNEKFTYRFEVAPNIQTEKILLPPMFIQPFIENALIHGILPASTPREIVLKISLKPNDILEIIIQDNGIGMKASAKNKKSTHTSRSMDIINQRIALMNEENNQNSITFEGNNQQGNKVIINLKTTFGHKP